MLNYRILINFFFIIFLALEIKAHGLEDVNFDHSSGIDLMRQYSAKYSEPQAELRLKLLNDNYERLKPSKVKSTTTPIIPKVIHQIWTGGNAMPANYRYFMETWRQYHPDWEFKLWTEQDILNENFENIDLILSARGYAEASDVIRYEILRKYGGLYIDTDIECFSNFDELHHKYEFYTNMEPPSVNKRRVSIVNFMIGSVPNHPIFTKALNQIRRDWDKTKNIFEETFSNHQSFFRRSNHHLAVLRTMYPFADAVFDYLSISDAYYKKTIVLPSSYNDPIYFINDTPIINYFSSLFINQSTLKNTIEKRPETMSIHFYDKENSLVKRNGTLESNLFSKQKLQKILFKLLNRRDKYFLAFERLFKINFPDVVQYSPKPIIAKTIYLDKTGLSEEEISSLSSKWKKMNPFFSIQIIGKKDFYSLIPHKFDSLSSDVKTLVARFYLLHQKGGVYVNKDFIPTNLAEFNHKFGYYGEFTNLNSPFEKLSLGLNIIAFRNGHTILRNMLNKIELHLSTRGNISEQEIRQIYLDKVYKYYELDGKSFVFPESILNQKRN